LTCHHPMLISNFSEWWNCSRAFVWGDSTMLFLWQQSRGIWKGGCGCTTCQVSCMQQSGGSSDNGQSSTSVVQVPG